MAPRLPVEKMKPENLPYGMGERRGAFVAHASTLLVGLPITFILLPVPLSLVPCPVVAYLLARAFRRRRLDWNIPPQATQAGQAIPPPLFWGKLWKMP